MKLYTSGEVAKLLGLHRDKVCSALRTADAPRPTMKVGNRYAYTEGDIFALCDWCASKSIAVTRPKFPSTV